jgi:hypothetical protein
MGSIINTTFDTEFIIRTQKLIKEYKGTYNITLLLNCLLGLIVVPSEFYNRKNQTFFKKPITDYQEINGLTEEMLFNPTKRDRKNNGFVQDQRTLNVFVKKIRNGIAHQRIECVEQRGKWTKVIIRDFNMANGQNVELELTWSIKQLKKFSIFISNEYIKEINQISEA